MKVIIAGPRGASIRIPPPLEWKWCVTQVVAIEGVIPTHMGMYWGNQNEIPLAYFKPEAHGIALDYADCLLAYWDRSNTIIANLVLGMMAKKDKLVHVKYLTPAGPILAIPSPFLAHPPSRPLQRS